MRYPFLYAITGPKNKANNQRYMLSFAKVAPETTSFKVTAAA